MSRRVSLGTLAAVLLCLPGMAMADSTGPASGPAVSWPALQQVGFGTHLTYEVGAAVVSGPVTSQPGGRSIERNAILAQTTRFWAKGFGFSSRTGADPFGPGYSVRGGGAAAGLERFVTPSLVLGAAISGTASRTESSILRSDADTGSLAGYASWANGGWEANGIAALNLTHFNNARDLFVGGTSVSTAGSVDAPGFGLGVDLGYRFKGGQALGSWYLKPLAGLTYSETDRPGYDEAASNLPGAYVSYPGQAFRRLASTLGADAGFTTGWGDLKMRPEIRLAWVHDFIDPSPIVNATLFTGGAAVPFSSRDPEPGRDGALVGVQLTVWKTAGLQGYISYTGEFRSNQDTHVGAAGIRLAW